MSSSELIGKQLGDYQILSTLGQGGMAHIFRGYDTKLERYAAVKVIDSSLTGGVDDEEYSERFKREARAIANLNHPRIVGVYQLGWEEVPGMGVVYYMAQAFIEGRDLRQVLKDYAKRGKALPYAQIMRIMRDIADALDYAHKHGVIHRDVKPSNIMVTYDGHAILTDFGLALRAKEGTTGTTFGSVHYIAPEQAVSSAQAVPQSDFYSLGVVLYEILTGQVPFDDNSAMSIALAHISDKPRLPTQLNPNIPQAVENVVLKMLEKTPERRYPNGQAFIAALETALKSSEEEDTHDLETGANDPFAVLSQDIDVDPSPSRPSLSNRASYKEATQHHFEDIERRKLATAAQKSKAALNQEDATFRSSEPFRSTQNTPPAAPPQKRSMLPQVIGGVLLLLLGVGGGIVLLGGGLNPQPTATPTTQAVVAAATETPDAPPTDESAAAPAATATSPHTPTATLTPSATFTPTATLTPSRTPTPTATPTPRLVAPADATALLLLRYDGTSIVLMNRSSEETLNINNLVFTNGTTTFEVADLPNFNNTPLPGEFCYQLWTTEFRTLPADAFPADACRSRRGFAQTTRTFWISEEEDAVFEVRRSGRVLGTCPSVPRIDREDNRCVVDIN